MSPDRHTKTELGAWRLVVARMPPTKLSWTCSCVLEISTRGVFQFAQPRRTSAHGGTPLCPARPPPPAKSHAWRDHLRGSPLPLARRPAQVGRGDLARAERARQPHLEQRVRAAGTRDGVPAPGGPNGMGNLGPAPQVPPQPYRGPHAPLRPSGQPRASGWAPSGHGWPCGAHG